MAGTPSPDALSVVLVEDSAEDQATLRRWLERDGDYVVVGRAGDGAAGLELCRRLQPDVVLVDINLPRVDGLRVLPQLRESCPDATCIAISGFSAASMRQRALDAGAHGYLEKARPVRLLRGDLRSILSDRRPQDTGDDHSTSREARSTLRVPFQRRDPRSPVVPGVVALEAT